MVPPEAPQVPVPEPEQHENGFRELVHKELLVSLYTADDPDSGVLFILSPWGNRSFRTPKYRFCTALGLKPLHVTVAPPVRLGVPLTEQLPPPGGEYDGPPSM